MVACPNQQSGSNPTRARFVLNRVELSFCPLYFYDNKYIRTKQLLSAENFVHYITRNKFTQASKEQPQTCWVFFNLITRIRNEKNRVIALHENPSNTYEQNDAGPISIYTHVYIYIRL